MSLSPIPVTVLAGFLGAGKTTLLNHILKGDHGRHIGIVVNDFGSINIDAELVTEVSEGVVTLVNGCICCSIRMDLINTVMQLAHRPDRPEHIVIESSGVADPAGIIKSFLDPSIWGTVRLDGVITVVDTEQFLALPEAETTLVCSQIAGGDLIILNKVDRVEAQTLAQLHTKVDHIRPGVQVFETTHCRLPMEILLGVDSDRLLTSSKPEVAVHIHEIPAAQEGPASDYHHDHAAHHDLLFDTWTFTSEVPLSMQWVQSILIHLPSTVFRVKGFVYAIEEPGSRMVVQLVGRRATVSPTRTWEKDRPQTRLVFISRQGTVNYPAIEQALRNCQVESPAS
jgi:G3E family GTPase